MAKKKAPARKVSKSKLTNKPVEVIVQPLPAENVDGNPFGYELREYLSTQVFAHQFFKRAGDALRDEVYGSGSELVSQSMNSGELLDQEDEAD